ncbi:TasA family protein [Modestobacter roseus]|uniref:TasA family protein n=1 Tax=Modestobacter roseus TaxID=1181884 RepID=UPI0034DFB88E
MNATRTTASNARRATAAKVLGSVGVVGAAALVAGMGTFGAFTDSTDPAEVSVASGVVSIDLTARDGSATVPVSFEGVVPGSSVTRALDLVNDGDSALASVELSTVATASSLLDSDTTNGLQMSVRSCSVAWAEDLSCAGTVRTLLAAGPVVRTDDLTAPASLTAGATDHLAVTLALPAKAGDAFKGQTSELALTFTATQAGGTAR